MTSPVDVKSGFLKKFSNSHSLSVPSMLMRKPSFLSPRPSDDGGWKRKWVRLEYSPIQGRANLLYYDKQSDPKPKATISLALASAKRGKEPAAIVVATETREYIFAADSQVEADEWISVISSKIGKQLEKDPLTVIAAQKAAAKKAEKERIASEKKADKEAGARERKLAKLSSEIDKVMQELRGVETNAATGSLLDTAATVLASYESQLAAMDARDFGGLSSDALGTAASAAKADVQTLAKDLGNSADKAVSAADKAVSSASASLASCRKTLDKLAGRVAEADSSSHADALAAARTVADRVNGMVNEFDGRRVSLKERRSQAKGILERIRERVTRMEREVKAAQGAENEGERKFEALRSAAQSASEEAASLQHAAREWDDAGTGLTEQLRQLSLRLGDLDRNMQALEAARAPQGTVANVLAHVTNERVPAAAQAGESLDATDRDLTAAAGAATSLRSRLEQEAADSARIRDKSIGLVRERITALKQHGAAASEAQQQVVLSLPQIDDIEQVQMPRLLSTLDTVDQARVQREATMKSIEASLASANAAATAAHASQVRAREVATSKAAQLSRMAAGESNAAARHTTIGDRLRAHAADGGKLSEANGRQSRDLQQFDQATVTTQERAAADLLQACEALLAHREAQSPTPTLIAAADTLRGRVAEQRRKAGEFGSAVTAAEKEIARLNEVSTGLLQQAQSLEGDVSRTTATSLRELEQLVSAVTQDEVAFVEGNVTPSLPDLRPLTTETMPTAIANAASLLTQVTQTAETTRSLMSRVAALRAAETDWKKLDRQLAAAEEARDKSLKRQRKAEDELSSRRDKLTDAVAAAQTETRRIFAAALALRGDAPKLATSMKATEDGLRDAMNNLSEADAELKRDTGSSSTSVLAAAQERRAAVQTQVDRLRSERDAQSKEVATMVKHTDKLGKDLNALDAKHLSVIEEDLAKLDTLAAAAVESAAAHPDGNLRPTLPDMSVVRSETLPRIHSEFNQALAAHEEIGRQINSLTGQQKAIKGLDKSLKKQEKAVSGTVRAAEKERQAAESSEAAAAAASVGSSSTGSSGSALLSSAGASGIKALTSNLRRNTGASPVSSAAAVFGVPLANMSSVPDVVLACTRWLTKSGLHVEGLFRISGDARELETLRKAADAGTVPTFSDNSPPHLVAGLLKLWLRQLPEPVVPYDRYSEWLSTAISATDASHAMATVDWLVGRLPPISRQLFALFAPLWGALVVNEAETRMNAANLCVVFCPVLLRGRTVEEEGAGMQAAMATVTAAMGVFAHCARTRAWPPFVASNTAGPAAVGPAIPPGHAATLRRTATAGSAVGPAARQRSPSPPRRRVLGAGAGGGVSSAPGSRRPTGGAGSAPHMHRMPGPSASPSLRPRAAGPGPAANGSSPSPSLRPRAASPTNSLGSSSPSLPPRRTDGAGRPVSPGRSHLSRSPIGSLGRSSPARPPRRDTATGSRPQQGGRGGGGGGGVQAKFHQSVRHWLPYLVWEESGVEVWEQVSTTRPSVRPLPPSSMVSSCRMHLELQVVDQQVDPQLPQRR
jgi:predicted  nucleic acid-binding Zn-ribbon protein